MILKEQYKIDQFKTQRQYEKLREKLIEKVGEELLDEVLNTIIEFDPTFDSFNTINEVGRYQEDILKLFQLDNSITKQDIISIDFLDSIYDLFDKYDKTINYLKSKNKPIESIKSLSQLKSFVTKYENQILQRMKKKQIYSTSFKELGDEIVQVQQDSEYDVFIPLTKRQSQILGKDTKWCISQVESTNHFNNEMYKHQPFLIAISKKEKDYGGRFYKFQFHLDRIRENSESYWDSFDNEIGLIDLRQRFILHPGLLKALKKVEIDIEKFNLEKVSSKFKENLLNYKSSKLYSYVMSFNDSLPLDRPVEESFQEKIIYSVEDGEDNDAIFLLPIIVINTKFNYPIIGKIFDIIFDYYEENLFKVFMLYNIDFTKDSNYLFLYLRGLDDIDSVKEQYYYLKGKIKIDNTIKEELIHQNPFILEVFYKDSIPITNQMLYKQIDTNPQIIAIFSKIGIKLNEDLFLKQFEHAEILLNMYTENVTKTLSLEIKDFVTEEFIIDMYHRLLEKSLKHQSSLSDQISRSSYIVMMIYRSKLIESVGILENSYKILEHLILYEIELLNRYDSIFSKNPNANLWWIPECSIIKIYKNVTLPIPLMVILDEIIQKFYDRLPNIYKKVFLYQLKKEGIKFNPLTMEQKKSFKRLLVI